MKLNKKEIRVLSGLLLTEQAELTDLIELSDGNDKINLVDEFIIVKELLKKLS